MSDEVSQFLEQVERLRGQQIEEDEVRARELEEYLAAKRERQARREERARSISPQKSSPANTPSPRSSRRSVHLSDALKLESPGLREDSAEPEQPIEAEVHKVDRKMSNPSDRGSPLSWQRRPSSRGGGGGVRPLSMLAAQNATQRSLAASPDSHPQSASEATFSRDQIAQALGSKDPSWFRQTADRGQGSAAYRKNQVEDTDRLDMSTASAQLPGLTQSGSSTPLMGAALDSPAPLTTDDQPGQTSPARSTSPTKGMGGFVQSAMMKRSDSVKRWSVTSPPGLARADSIASNRVDRGATFTRPRSPTKGAVNTPTPGSSRPTSRHGEEQQTDTKAPELEPEPEPEPEPEHEPEPVDPDDALPTSPSKTMDPRRWSPTKTSWLESALNKPEAPKPQSKPASPAQPSWRVDFNKNKTDGSTNSPSELGRSGSISHRHQVSIGGLMRSSPMGSAIKTNTTGLGGIYSPPPNANRPAFGHGGSRSVPKNEFDKDEDSEKRAAPAPAPKPKPETPPKKDFRSTLKQRPVDAPAARADEPEFKNVFGNLRRTKTQNYKAPDELKDNILRGKASLNQTGGPKKTERKDEFKEAILKKKEDFKKAQDEGKGITRNPTITGDKPIPEGLARRAELGKPTRPEPSKAASPKPVPGPKRVPSQPLSPASPLTASPELEKLDRVSTEPAAQPETDISTRPPSLQKETSAPSRLQQGRGKLADRFNPALAGMLARGPPPAASGPKSSAPASTSTTEPTPGPQLTHMTKGRARGPKRKAPSSAQRAGNEKQENIKPEVKKDTAPVEKPEQPKQEAVPVESIEKPAPLSIQQQVAAKASLRGRPLPLRTRDDAPTTTRTERIFDAPSPLKPHKTGGPSSPLKSEPPSPLKPHKTGDASPKKLDMKRMSRFLDNAAEKEPAREPIRLTHQRTGSWSPTKMNAEREPAREPMKLTHQRTGSWSPVKMSPTKMFERPLQQPAAQPAAQPVQPAQPRDQPVQPTQPRAQPVQPAQLRDQLVQPAQLRDQPVQPEQPRDQPVQPVAATPRTPAPLSPVAKVKSPPLKPKPSFDIETPSKAPRPLPAPPVDTPNVASPPTRSPSRHGVDISKTLSDFFGPERPRSELKVDPAEILMSAPPADAKVKTMGRQMFRLSGDGKRVPVPAHFERVLFDQEMYLCAHEFAYSPGKTIFEVYFWVGDEVAESAAQDAQLFAQREARALAGKLVKLRQGKETSEFLQALGGIVITRRGSSERYDSLASSMLCGRRYLGQIAFDEVDFAPTSLCAGFPYLIVKGGNCHLWKGKGSEVDELSCARLVGMDLTLTGELIEHEDGAEPESFWELLEGPKPHSADHWRLKPSYSRYCSRLFCSDADSRQQIFEIRPFTQADLNPLSVYVLDAFFEIYIIVGSRAQSQYASFRIALDFAQEYAILAAGMEDRPFVPISTVVLEGIPRDMKSVFRKWTDGLSPTITNPPSRPGAGLKRKKSLKLVPLTQALQALKD